MKKNIIFLILVCFCSLNIIYYNTVFAEQEGEIVNDTFSGFDGLVPQGWSNGGNAVWNGCKGTIQDNKMKFIHVGKNLGFPSWRTLKNSWTDKTVLISYDFKMTTPVDRAAYFPIITDGAETIDVTKAVTHLSFSGDTFILTETVDGEKKKTGLPVKLEIGKSYKFGFEIDLKERKQNLYVVKDDSEYYELRDCNFYNPDVNSIKFIYFMTYLALESDVLGEYEIDNFAVREKNEETFAEFQEKLCKNYKVNVDNLKDIRKFLDNRDVLLFTDTPYVITKAGRTLLDSENEEVTPVIENGRTLVPLRFISENIGAAVNYNNGEIEILFKDEKLNITIGKSEYFVNGERKEFDVPAKIINGRTMVPIRTVAEALGMEILWKEEGLIGICSNKEDVEKNVDRYLDRIIKTFGIFVSPIGNDENDGTKNRPVKTMQGARELVYALKSGTGIPEGGMTVYFDDENEIDALTTADIGNEKTPIKYIAR